MKKWTKQSAEKYIDKIKKSKGILGLTYWSAKDYLKHHKTMSSIIQEENVFDNLKEIVIVKADTKEVLAIIPNDDNAEIVQKKDIIIRMNYGEKRKYIGNENTGKVYLVDKEQRCCKWKTLQV